MNAHDTCPFDDVAFGSPRSHLLVHVFVSKEIHHSTAQGMYYSLVIIIFIIIYYYILR